MSKNPKFITLIFVLYITLIAPAPLAQGQNEIIQDEITEEVQTEIKEVIVDVLFESDNNELGSQDKEALSTHAEALINNPGVNAVLEGYSDSTGSESYNVELSKIRAETVMDYLISQGVPPESLSVDPRGGTERFAEGDTEQALSANRRVRMVYEIPVVTAPQAPLPDEEAPEETREEGILSNETPEEQILDTEEIEADISTAETPLPEPTAEPPAPTPPPSLLDAIGSSVQITAPGEIIFETPKTMQLETSYLVEAKVSDAFISNLTSALNEKTQIQNLKLREEFLVLLTGSGFEVQPLEDSFNSRDLFPEDHGARSEPVTDPEEISWKWSVTPVKAGFQPLLLSVIVDIEEPRYEQLNTEHDIYKKIVDVREGFLRSLVGSYWLTSFIVLLVIAVVSWVILGKFNMI